MWEPVRRWQATVSPTTKREQQPGVFIDVTEELSGFSDAPKTFLLRKYSKGLVVAEIDPSGRGFASQGCVC